MRAEAQQLAEWAAKLTQGRIAAEEAKAQQDREPTISVAELTRWRSKIINHGGKSYEVTVKELEIFC